jgi:hypothetical protein
MQFLVDIITGRQHRLVRDYLVAGATIAIVASGAGHLVAVGSQSFLEASVQQPLPTVAQAREPRVTTYMRSVLDEPEETGTIVGSLNRTRIDPCTGAPTR